MRSFKFVHMADIQFGLFAFSSGKGEEDIAALAQRGLMIRPAPPITGTGPEEELFSTVIKSVNELQPAFAVMCGDIANDPQQHDQFKSARDIAASIRGETPFHWVAGNHDISTDFRTPDRKLLEAYRQEFGKDFYSFRVEGAGFYVINSTVLSSPGSLATEAEAQIEFLENELIRAKADGIVINAVFSHHPPFLERPDEPDSMWNISMPYRKRLLDVLERHDVSTIFAGHLHRNHVVSFDGLEVICSGPVGYPLGADPSGYRVVTVDETGFSHRYVPIAQPPDNTVARGALNR